LHGTDTAYYSRPPRDSEGCVVLTNKELDMMDEYIQPGVTPVIITESIRWMDRDHWLSQRDELLAAIRRWQQDWESNDVDRYLSHYDASFWSPGHNLKSWSSRKRRINRNKQFQQVELDNISLFRFPVSASKGEELALADFRQFYRSNNYNSDMRKRLYLKHNETGWKILYEGSER
jgi:murein L,D-transpeptidase YafK